MSSAASAANAAIDHVHDWVLGAGAKWVTMGIASDGSYGIPEGTIYGFPVTCANGKFEMIKGLEIDSFTGPVVAAVAYATSGGAELPPEVITVDLTGEAGGAPMIPTAAAAVAARR